MQQVKSKHGPVSLELLRVRATSWPASVMLNFDKCGSSGYGYQPPPNPAGKLLSKSHALFTTLKAADCLAIPNGSNNAAMRCRTKGKRNATWPVSSSEASNMQRALLSSCQCPGQWLCPLGLGERDAGESTSPDAVIAGSGLLLLSLSTQLPIVVVWWW